MAIVFFVVSLIKMKEETTQAIALVLSAAVFVISVASTGQAGSLFLDAYQVDAFSQVFKVIITFGLFLVIYMGTGLKGIESGVKPEYYMFLTISSLGLVMMTSSVELLTILICLEISSFALYVIIPFRNAGAYRSQMEAGIKYVLFGAAATGITLYGMSYIFGLTHTTYLAELTVQVPALAGNPLGLIAIIMILCGFFYKLALFPMHFWAPDVYEGSADETAGFIATLPKIGAVALLMRLTLLAGVDVSKLTFALASFAVLSMTVGNLCALVQNDVKRILAYSSIAHAGYVMIGILCVNELGFASAVYYIAGYLLMNLACFYVVYNVSENGKNVTLDDLGGLYKRSPLLAFTMAVGAFGMAGIPPTIGFTGKFLVFTAAIQKGFYFLVILAVINAAIAAFYYLKLVRASYMTSDNTGDSVVMGFSARVMGLFLIGVIILTGILPQFFIEMAKEAVAGIF